MRNMIREILAEELGRMQGASPNRVTEEVVSIRSSADLQRFAERLLDRARDGRLAGEMAAGRHRFVLDHGHTASSAPPVHAHQPAMPSPKAAPQAEFSRGMVTEKDVAGLDSNTRALRIGKSVRLTPLAMDELQRRGITIERIAS